MLYSIGGWGGPFNGPMADVDAYDSATGNWTRRPSLPVLGSAVAAATGGVIHAVVDGRQFYALAP